MADIWRSSAAYRRRKRVDRAIAIARAVGLPLKIAAKVDRVDEEYFKAEIAPLLDQPGIEFIGEIDERQKGSSWAMRALCSFPSIGRSRSGW